MKQIEITIWEQENQQGIRATPIKELI
jgi:hypothetical protein